VIELSSTTLKSHLVARLRNGIVLGYYRPGERLNESKIAREFAVSRIPAREALMQLQEQGLVMNHPRILRISLPDASGCILYTAPESLIAKLFRRLAKAILTIERGGLIRGYPRWGMKTIRRRWIGQPVRARQLPGRVLAHFSLIVMPSVPLR
jgi:hypothetical protein